MKLRLLLGMLVVGLATACGGDGGGGGGGGGGGESAAQRPEDRPEQPQPRPSSGIGGQQAERLLNSAAREEGDVQSRKQSRNRPEPPPGGKDW